MSLEELILEREQRLVDPERRRQPDRIRDLLDDDFVEHGSSGRVFTKAEALAAMASAPGRAPALEGFQVRELAPGCALATFRTAEGGRRSLRCSIWRLRGGEWRVLFHQGTPCPP